MKAATLSQLQTTLVLDHKIVSDSVVQATKPSCIGQYVSLQRYDGTNVLQWFVSDKPSAWTPHGQPIVLVANNADVLVG